MRRIIHLIASLCICISFNLFAAPFEQGIYISHSTMENTALLDHLIHESKATGINTFVIDYAHRSSTYRKNIQKVKDSGIKYVARVVVFPHGGTSAQIRSEAYWQKIYLLVEAAIELGADEIQLDYIRYTSKQPPSSRNTDDVVKVLAWFKSRLAAKGIPLQADMFGVSSYREIKSIGQSVPRFAEYVDAICPMNYPSHWEPYKEHAKTPYTTVLNAVKALKAQLNDDSDTKVYPYIELYNYRYKMSQPQLFDYIEAQIDACIDGHADGWYAWSPNNKYHNLFTVLKRKADNKNIGNP